MKRTTQRNLLLIGLVILLAGCTSEKKNEGFTVKAKINNPENYTMYLAYQGDSSYVIDTSYTMEDGWPVFKGKVDEPVVASLGVRGNPKNTVVTDQGFIPGPSLNFVLSNENIEIEGNADDTYMARVIGGKANEEWNTIKGELNKITGENWQSTKKRFAAETTAAEKELLNKQQQENSNREKQLTNDFIKSHPNSFVSMYLLAGKVNELDLADLKTAYSQLGNEYKNTSYGKSISDKIKNMEATAIGQSAIPINKKDLNGNPVNLETLKGKYVLLDFWGSWCGPCRESFPHLKELYAKYKDMGFEILGIALEQRDNLEDNKKIWKQTVKEDSLPWLQVLDNEDRDKFDAVKSYGVTAFPTQILLDKEGKIIARYVGESADLDKKLKEIFSK